MAFVFAATTPLGIVIGLAAQTTYDSESPRALAIAGIFDSISAGTPRFRSRLPVGARLLACRLPSVHAELTSGCASQ